jgi:hypothetical protein
MLKHDLSHNLAHDLDCTKRKAIETKKRVGHVFTERARRIYELRHPEG